MKCNHGCTGASASSCHFLLTEETSVMLLWLLCCFLATTNLWREWLFSATTQQSRQDYCRGKLQQCLFNWTKMKVGLLGWRVFERSQTAGLDDTVITHRLSLLRKGTCWRVAGIASEDTSSPLPTSPPSLISVSSKKTSAMPLLYTLSRLSWGRIGHIPFLAFDCPVQISSHNTT